MNWMDKKERESFERSLAEIPRIFQDAKRWRWLREQKGWPDTEAAVSGYTPEQFDAMADKGLTA